MVKWKRIFTNLLIPHIVFLILLIPISTILLIYAFAADNPYPPIQYCSYAVSAYTLIILCVRIPFLVQSAKKFKNENKYAVRYFSDAQLRVKLSLYGLFGINTLYAALHLTLGILYHSVWFYAISGYYFLLAFMRFLLLRGAKTTIDDKNKVREYKKYRLCGIVLLLMNILLSMIVLYVVRHGRGSQYHYIVTIAMATHTFTTFTMAIIDMVRYQKYNSPIISAAKQINFASALVSMLSLETVMLKSFGDSENVLFNQIMTASTGTVVCVAILGMTLYMLVHSTKQIRKENIHDE